VRIVGGELGGRRLIAPPRGSDVRPTPDRVREALFSILGERVEDAEVLDLYSGTGALSLEALSRGASRATLVDDNTALAQRNVDALSVGARVRLVRSDVERYLARERGEFSLIFCDPPYRLADRLQARLDKDLPGRLADDGVVVIESATRNPLRLSMPQLTERRYGDTLLGIYSKPANDG
jgi:16S rRNA (guanine966-N2)-methyltransferase